jgi:hypothetical protein
MKKQTVLFILLAFSFILSGCSKDESPTEPVPEQYTVISGNNNTILTISGSPYRVINTILVDSSSTLTIEAGVRIYFEDSTQLFVRGKLSCIGNSTTPILFTSKNASWKGIQITRTSTLSVIQFTIIENVDLTIKYDTIRNGAVEVTNAKIVIQNSIFRNNKSNNGGGLYLDQSNSTITNNIFINNYAVGFGGALLSSSSSNKIVNNTFYNNGSNNYAGGLLLVSSVIDSVQNNIFYANTNASGDPRISFFHTDSSHYIAMYNFLEAANNPNFVSVTDFHLSISSPCINAGNPDSKYNNVDGTRNDQGAYGGPLGSW